ncbi:MAG: FAD-dependent thymidylate synthase [Thermoanaerobaculum sp.]|nr:FAD-dependent thymidylate synthase [Thermoanaerobaculum sp.]
MVQPPRVRLVAAFPRPVDVAVAAARSCYATQLVSPEQVAGEHLRGEALERARAKRDALAQALYLAGHHTTFQHAHFLFALEGVSRQFVWSFLHAHPFANSEQVSQRFVPVAPEAVYQPPSLPQPAQDCYAATVGRLHAAYRDLVSILAPVAEAELLKRFPTWRRHPERLARQTQRKAQEVARSVLPLATLTSLYHTVSCLTLFRYRRLCQQVDVPEETRTVVEAMVAEALAWDPQLGQLFQDPMPLEDTLEYQLFTEFCQASPQQARFRQEFDRLLAGRTSRLISRGQDNEKAVAGAVRAVLGLPAAELSDGEAIELVLNPARNRLLGEELNLTTLSKLTRALYHAHYTFAKKLSHAADSQDQRHRMTPAARPLLWSAVDEEPDVVVPTLIRYAGEPALSRFWQAVERAWDGAREVLRRGGSREQALYLLPNALAVRFVESADLLNLVHKHRMRLCYNAQEEIWQACWEEAEQIAQQEPYIGRWLLPPCTVRKLAGKTPICPEGERFCGVPVWRLERKDYRRLI